MAKEENVTRCGMCQNYLELAEPFHYEKSGYPEGVTVYGFCAKDARSRGGFYPVYLPDGGKCITYRKKKEAKSSHDERTN